MENSTKLSLSVVILTKNEEETIGSCIDSVLNLSPQELIVIDDESTDATISVAKKRGARIIRHKKQNFAEMRNFALSKVNTDWIFYIDADEQCSRELVEEIKEQIIRGSSDAFRIQRINYYLGKKWPTAERVTRLFQKQKLKNWYGELHESPSVDGKLGDLNFPLIHHTHRDLIEMVVNTIHWSAIEAKLRYGKKHPPISWWRIPRVMIPTFFDYYIRQRGWKVGTRGLIESMYQAFSICITYARLWEMQQKPTRSLQ